MADMTETSDGEESRMQRWGMAFGAISVQWWSRSGLLLLALAALPLRAAAGEGIDFQRDIMPLFKAHCVKCHGPLRQEANLNLSTPLGVARGGKTGVAVRPGALTESPLWDRVSAGEMPPRNPLAAQELAILEKWISAGAPGLPDPAKSHPQDIEHWAFRSLTPPTVPQVRGVERIRTDIDRFIQKGLQDRKLGLGPRADRSTLIRRVSFDTTGLPPTLEELTLFLEDSAPDAYERMVDRYLASPRYGERWGKHWLDVAGYADSNGYFDADTERPLAYRYRDYVVRSMNRDKPFDAFIREQLAGDEMSGHLPGAPADARSIELLEATHFLRNPQDGTGESDGNPDEVMRDRRAVLEATVELFGSALFGLTLKCAKCHDHKFEPVTQQDYYQLQAILAPAFDVNHWVKPKDRYVYAPSLEELARFNEALSAGKAHESDRPGKIASVSDLSQTPPQVHILLHGNVAEPGPEVAPDGLHVLSDPNNPFTRRPFEKGAHSTGVRLAFANWLTHTGSRPAALLARVHINRVWQKYFGRGLVSTPENLGYSGTAPTHPELLEWLTSQFVNSGWSMKFVHRLIMTSAVYRQTSELQPDAFLVDPDNRFLWRMPIRRLDAEAIRDSLLAISGDLDLQMGGPPVATVRTGVGEVQVDDNSPGERRRSIYIEQRRTRLPTILRVFDAPSIVNNCVERSVSTVPLQSLTLLNSEFMRVRASNLARRLALEASRDSDDRISHAFLLALSREPDVDEVRASLQFLRTQSSHYFGRSEAPQRQAWTDFCHMVLATNAFLYLD